MDSMRIVEVLNEHGVEYVLVGRSAAWLHGVGGDRLSSLELCYRQHWRNCECLNRALEELGAESVPPPEVPIPLTKELRSTTQMIQVRCPHGYLCLMSELKDMGNYDQLRPGATVLEHEDLSVPVLSRPQLSRWLQLACQSGDTGSLNLLLNLERLHTSNEEPQGETPDRAPRDVRANGGHVTGQTEEKGKRPKRRNKESA